MISKGKSETGDWEQRNNASIPARSEAMLIEYESDTEGSLTSSAY